ncbi:STAS domain-containing protein [Brevibacillus fluminis]|uniref:STAS domain-containing protein n=1 Tax=Brevibacillus fluminis TaxID=511487 RepID=UPI003F8C5126
MNLTMREQENEQGEVILFLQGEVDAYTAPMVSERLTPIILSNRFASVTIDLAEVTYMDSTGIGVLIGALKASKQSGCSMLVRRIPSRIDRLFQITGLKDILTIVSSEGGKETK